MLVTTYTYNLSTLRRYIHLIRSGKLAKDQVDSLLRDCRELARQVDIHLEDPSSAAFGKRVDRRYQQMMRR